MLSCFVLPLRSPLLLAKILGGIVKNEQEKEFFAYKSMRMKMSQGLEEKSGGAIEHTKRRKKN